MIVSYITQRTSLYNLKTTAQKVLSLKGKRTIFPLDSTDLHPFINYYSYMAILWQCQKHQLLKINTVKGFNAKMIQMLQYKNQKFDCN